MAVQEIMEEKVRKGKEEMGKGRDTREGELTIMGTRKRW